MNKGPKKLNLNAETLRRLDTLDLKAADGAAPRTVAPTVCTTCTYVCSGCQPCA